MDTKDWYANLVFNGVSPDDLLSKSQGSKQVLSNGNVLVNWGSEGAITEFKNERPIFNAFVDSQQLCRNYRGFKSNWIGKPNEKIAVMGEYTNDGSTDIYVSWNGDTETNKWKFYSVENNWRKPKNWVLVLQTIWNKVFKSLGGRLRLWRRSFII